MEDVKRGRVAGATLCLTTAHAVLNREHCVTSDFNGEFSVALTGAATRLLASAAGYLPAELAIASSLSGERVTLTLEGGAVEVAGTVVDASGGAVIGALVSSSLDGAGRAAAFTDGAGAFRLGVASGWVNVTAEAEAYSRASVRVHAPTAGVSLVVAPGSRIDGVVVSEDDLPLAGVTVSAQIEGRMNDGPIFVQSQADGTFELLNVAPGQYALEAVGEHFRSPREAAFIGVGQASASVVLRAERAAYLEGTLLVDEQPCEGAYATVSGPVEAVASFDAAGAVRLDGLLPGRYEVAAACSSIAADIRETVDVGREPVMRRWSVAAAPAVRGVVVTPNGRLLAGVAVDVRPLGEPAARRGSICSTDASGKFTCPGLASGPYSARVLLHDAPGSNEVRFDVGNGPASPIVLRTAGVGAIRAIINGSGQACASACGSVTPVLEGERNLRLYGEPEGDNFAFRDLPLGNYKVSVGADVKPVVLSRDEETVDVHIDSPPRASVLGRVVDVAGQPLSDVWVNVVSTEPEWLIATVQIPPAMSDAEGFFELSGLIPGRYSIQGSHDGASGQLGLISPGDLGVVLTLEPRMSAGELDEVSAQWN